MNKKLYQLMNWPEIEEIVYSESDNPHKILGATVVGNQTLLQTFQPGAKSINVKLKKENKLVKMEEADEAGFFACLIPEKKIEDYEYVVTQADGTVLEVQDAYQFEPVLTKKDTDKFQAGIHYTVYECLGAHAMTLQHKQGVHFAVWAPNAIRVSVVGDFNHWDGRTHQMRRLWDSGIFEIFIPDVKSMDCYKFEIKAKGGLTYLKADPYAFFSQLRPDNASVVYDSSNFVWEDETWILSRQNKRWEQEAISVYEVHLGSFQKPETGFYNYRELAPLLISYVNQMGYTHIELMPVMEHPLDESWGYQVIGYYSPTSRYGTPEDFMYFMNEMHKAGIGVILDWVPAHFPRDTHGLSGFDGTCLYEHQDPRKGFHPHWGTLIYNYGRPQVSNYLIANALFWVERYHVDGIRMDAVASMLYLDYGKQDGEWVANIYGGNENLEAVEFLKHLNSMMKKRGNGAITIAEESTAWPRITGNLKDDGLGFDFKWNMGWMNDYLDYIKYDPYFRSHHHGELTFSMIYAYSEKFMLVFSHDEVVHGKASLLSKMPGKRKEQFANLRATFAYMMMHPGQKLIFMGQDIAEISEWSEQRSVEWGLLEQEDHKGLNLLVQELNAFYRTQPALFMKNHDPAGFEWINSISGNECVLAFLRKGELEEGQLLVVCNFANKCYTDYKIGVPFHGKYKEIFNSDAQRFGGSNQINARAKSSKKQECDNRDDSIKITVAPLSVSVFSCTRELEELKESRKVKEKKEVKKAKDVKAVKNVKTTNVAKTTQVVKETNAVETSEPAKKEVKKS